MSPGAALPVALAAELAPTGVLRVGINLGNPVIAQPGPEGGEPRGVGPALGREFARRCALPIAFVTYETAGKVADAMKAGELDAAFLAIDPARAADIEFAPAYVHIEGTYLVAEGSPLQAVAEVDREGRRIAVGLKTAYDLYLTREIRHASLVRASSSPEAIEQFVREKLDCAAGVRQPLESWAAAHPGYRVLGDAFMVIRQAAGVPKGRLAAARHLAQFIEEAKRSGFVAQALRESGQGEVTIAPAAP
jgi:polar amino acid transport system substrate-binding protein